MTTQILKSQRGRSMVEMLGVLAIVGVLSVGGVYGYGVAMKKHKANELLHQASMLATTISAQIQSKGELPQSIEDFGNGKYGEFKEPEKANDEQFTMQITGMDPAVCEQVAKMAGGMVRKAECTGTTLTLTYNNNLSSDKVAADYNGKQEECEESGNKYCEGSGSCIVQDKDCCAGYDSQCCVDDGDISSTESCVLPDGSDGKCNNGECVVIMGTECGSGYYSSCEETGGECVNGFCKCPSGTVFALQYGNSACVSCSDLETAFNSQTCEACGKVAVMYYPHSYPDGDMPWACFDKPSTECKSNEMFSGGTCVPCSSAGNRSGGYYNGVEQCEKCGLENNGSGICIKKCPAGTIYAMDEINYYSDCYSCNTEGRLSPAKGNCSQICPNRNDNCELVSKTCIHGTKNGDSCVCESGWYGKYCESDCDGVKDEFGYCHMCSYSDDLYVTSIDECHNCDDRIFYGNTCASCSDESDIPCDKSECDRCPNRVYENGVCRLKVFRCLDSNYNEKVCQCSDITPTNSIRTNDSAECEKCDGVKYWMGSSSCGVIDCGTGYIQSAFGGVCVPINTTQPTAIMVDPEYADTCNSLGWFYAEGGFCCNSQKVKECKEAGAERPSDCPSIKLV